MKINVITFSDEYDIISDSELMMAQFAPPSEIDIILEPKDSMKASTFLAKLEINLRK